MNSKKLLHTPDGVRDIYNLECAQKEAVQKLILHTFHLYGYRSIQTPTFEFFDIFDKEKGSVPSRDLYKFFDREGNTLVLRPDITPSIARCTAKYFMEEDMPIRLCYHGNTFVNSHSYQGRLKETTVLGAEMIGDMTSDADAEMIAMLINCLLKAGLRDFQVEIGQIDYFNGLMQEAKLDEEEQEALRNLIVNKNYFGVEEMLSSKALSEDVKNAILNMPKMFGNIEIVREAKGLVKNEVSLYALERLEKLHDILIAYGLEKYITFDLGMLGKFQYYTGIIFKAYTYGTGDAIATGGRYDQLLNQFGKDASSTGFGILLDDLLTAMGRQKVEIETEIAGTILLYDRKQKMTAIGLADKMREKGISLQLMKKFHEKTVEDYLDYAKRSFVEEFYYLDESGALTYRNVLANTSKAVDLDQFLV